MSLRNTVEVHHGLHAKIKNSKLWDSCKVVIMYIPKGAKYYLGVNGDIVSNQMVWYK